MHITLLQTDIVWEDKNSNLRRLRDRLEGLRGTTEIVVLPEMFTTGFSMNSDALAETVEGETMACLRQWAAEYDLAICGSFICREAGKRFNRAFFVTPEGEAFFYDKKHLFRMGDEGNHFDAGEHRLIVPYRGWNICLMVCYDLRFPVWSRNTGNAYDVLVYVASWPKARRSAWDVLLRARAIENLCYVCGVNRTGTDGNGLLYDGGSVAYSPKGELLAAAQDGVEEAVTAQLNRDALEAFRKKFPAWKDADEFCLNA